MKDQYKTAKISLLLSFFFFFLISFASGCDKNKSYIIFSSKPITRETLQPEKTFEIGERVNFAVLYPKGFKNPLVRIQIIKRNSKTDIMGYTMEQARDIEIDTSKNFFIDSFCIYNAGGFYFRVFSHNDFQKPVAETEFWIH